MFEENDISINANGGTEIAKRKLAKILPADLLEHFQIISSRVRELKDDKIRVYWCHDLPQDPEMSKIKDQSYRDQFHQLVFISNWQYQQTQNYLGVPYSAKSLVIESGIDPIASEQKPTDKIRLVYTSTPQRGLALLLGAFDVLHKKYPNIELDVFSSFKIYGWDEYDKEFEPLYELCREHEAINYHGFVPHEELIDHLKKCHIFAYPSIWPETSCRAMLEAMSAKLLCVHPNFGGLWDTSGSMNIMYQGDRDPNVHVSVFLDALDRAIAIVKDDYEAAQNYLNFNKNYVDNRFHIEKIKMQWEQLLKELLTKYPTPESRAISKSSMYTVKI